MKIQTICSQGSFASPETSPTVPHAFHAPQPNAPQKPAEPADGYVPSEGGEPPNQPKKYKAWEPFAAGAVAGLMAGVPAALGAAEHQLFGPGVASALTAFVTPAVAGLGLGTWAYRSSKKEFNGHPVLVGICTLGAGTAGLVLAPLLKAPGAAFGWAGAAASAAIAGTVVGIGSAVAMHKFNQNNA